MLLVTLKPVHTVRLSLTIVHFDAYDLVTRLFRTDCNIYEHMSDNGVVER